jgi:hypothetical protein
LIGTSTEDNALHSLDALVGGDDEKRMLWMSPRYRALDGVPIDLIKRADDLVHVVSYLDVMRPPLRRTP